LLAITTGTAVAVTGVAVVDAAVVWLKTAVAAAACLLLFLLCIEFVCTFDLLLLLLPRASGSWSGLRRGASCRWRIWKLLAIALGCKASR
jgi:hypothetical protein